METEKTRRLCSRCVLPEREPGIVLDADGVCSVCREHDRSRQAADRAPLETDFLKLIGKYRGKSRYECLVMCSGGKDSTSALYYMARRYGLNPLAFMFDHGFETEEAKENVRNAVESLGIDFLQFKSDFMKALFARILETRSKAVICHPCSIWYMRLAFDLAARFEIPMIVAGWTKGQSAKQEAMSKCGCSLHAPEFAEMGRETLEFLERHLKDMPMYRDFPRSMEEVLEKARRRFKSIVVSPHWFLPFAEEEYVETIQRELNWRCPTVSYPAGSTNCLLNFISVHNSMKHYGYTHYHVEMSKLIREGRMTREEALERLRADFAPEFLDSIAARLGQKVG